MRKLKKNNRKTKPVLYIYTEGSETEPKYIRGYIKDYLNQSSYSGKSIKICANGDSQPYRLYESAISELNKNAITKNDIIWLVFDCDEHPKLMETFNQARQRNINIAFSSICFETWILLHFNYSSRSYSNYDDLRKNSNLLTNISGYGKSRDDIFDICANNKGIDRAKANAKRLRLQQQQDNQGTPIYQLNPYTNVDELLDAMVLSVILCKHLFCFLLNRFSYC